MFSKKVNRCFASLICVFALLTVLAIPASAVSVTGVSGVEVTVDGNGSISESGGTVTVTAKGSFTSAKTATVTVTNTSGSTANISFDYSGTNVGSTSLGSTSGTKTFLLMAGSTTTFTITSKSWTTSTTATMKLSNFKVEAVAAESNVTVTYGSLGSVKMDGTTVASGSVNSVSSTTGATFVAVPGSGSKFVAWINPATNAVLSTSATYQLIPTEAMAIRAVFANASAAPVFWADGTAKVFEGLDAALSYASSASNKTITLASDGTLPAGNYTIPTGVTLLIPYNAANTLCTTKPTDYGGDSYVKPTAYRTLTMAAGANIAVDGAISVSGSQSPKYKYNGMPSGPVGFINMKSGSAITVNSGAYLYVWGYITGSGSVSINNGGTVYECFQIADYRGGDVTTSMNSNADTYGVFPFNQYYLQNVEVPMTLYAGAIEKGYSSVTVTLAGTQPLDVPFISSSGSMFNITSGYIVKDYAEGTGRTNINVYGDLSVSEVTMSLKAAMIGTVNIETSKYVLPIPHHFTVNVESGNITMDQSVAFLPGSELTVREGAVCTLGSGKKIYIYDLDQWLYNDGANGYSGTTNLPYMQLKYVPGKDGTTGRLKDAQIQIDGTIDASAGSIYVTEGGANIFSTGTGVVKVNPGTDTGTYQVITADTDVSSWPEISIRPALLKNGEAHVETDPYTSTDLVKNGGYGAGTYTYCSDTGLWCPPGHRYGEGVVTSPTCTTAGYTTYTCIACGHSYTDTEVAATGHTEVVDAAVAPTCTATGLTEGKHCSVCKEVLVAQEVVAATGHKDENGDNKCDACGISLEVISVTITWGSMNFTYTPGAWNPETHTYGVGTIAPESVGANVITITNGAETNIDLTASISYAKADGYAGKVTGSLDKTSIDLLTTAQEKSHTVTLTLSPNDEHPTSTTVGKVTVTISRKGGN